MPCNGSQNKWPTEDGRHIGHLNINNVINKIAELQAILYSSRILFHMFGVSDSRVTEIIPDNDTCNPGCKLDRKHPQCNLQTGLITHLEHYNEESVRLQIQLKHAAPIVLDFIYRNVDAMGRQFLLYDGCRAV